MSGYILEDELAFYSVKASEADGRGIYYEQQDHRGGNCSFNGCGCIACHVSS
jgi:hypothetical protein